MGDGILLHTSSWHGDLKLLIAMPFSPASCYFFSLSLSLWPKYSQHLFSNTLNLYSSLGLTDQVPYLYNGKKR
jgi:hypothetical protein